MSLSLSLSLYLQKEILIVEIRAKTDKVVELEKHVEEVSRQHERLWLHTHTCERL